MRTVYSLLFPVILLSACQKDKDNPIPPGNPPTYQYLVRSMEWDNGVQATVRYHADSTIQSIVHAHQASSEVVDYTWSGKQLATMAYGSSLYKNTFYYDNGRMVKMVNASKNGSSPTGYQFEYSYGGNGKLTGLKYSTINEGGARLVNATRYDYKANGDLQAIITTQTNNIVIMYTIDSFSPEFELHPWLFIGAALSEYYVLHNYPLLNQLNKLPAKMTKTVQEPGQAPRLDKVDESVYSVANKRLDKIVATLTYPGHPEYNQTQTTLFKY